MKHFTKTLFFVFLLFPFQNACASEMSKADEETEDLSPKHTVRFSAQSTPKIEKILKDCMVLLPNNKLTQFNFKGANKGRIPICDKFLIPKGMSSIALKIIGTGAYKGRMADVLFGGGRLKRLPTIIAGRGGLDAVRINFELRAPRKDKTGKIHPAFVRATGTTKYGRSLPTFSTVVLDKYGVLGKKNTFANDSDLLEEILKKNNFMRLSNQKRAIRYINRLDEERKENGKKEEGFGTLPSESVYIIGEYFKLAKIKYGTGTKAQQRQALSLLVHYDVIGRNKISEVEEFLGID